jgi:hypothetical protein
MRADSPKWRLSECFLSRAGLCLDVSRDELITSFRHLITSFASQLLASGIADNWARLITRKHVSPTDAFPIMYRVFRLLIEAAAQLLARITSQPPESEEVRISVMAMVGQALVFRISPGDDHKICGLAKNGITRN